MKETDTMNIQMIPLNRLIPCPANVRKTGAGIGIEELAASISAHGLLQNLQVRPGRGGKFEVAAGGRRLAALRRLAKLKTLSKLAEIGCNVLDDDEDPVEISLAENTNREPMHPADQFDAFKALADSGKGPEEIAGHFGCTAAMVRQRLKLASVSPHLMEVYRAGDMTLDQLMAFTVSDDHEVQEAVWFDPLSDNSYPNAIRRTLTASQIEADDRLALFVGVEAYVAAGGPINRDLFQTDHEGYPTLPC
jgi:ParB family chromosome partitioning protein